MAQRFFRNVENLYRGARHFGLIGGDRSDSAANPLPSGRRRNVFNEAGIFGDAQQAELDALQSQTENVNTLEFASGDGVPKTDWRARIRPKNTSIEDNIYFGGNILKPLRDSGGLVFQYTPNLYVGGAANWVPTHGVGQNYPVYTYNNSTPPSLPIVSTFTANTEYEARYMLAVMHWSRSITKSSFGEEDYASGRYGTPPPILQFEYLGEHGFNRVPIVVTGYAYSYPPDVDYVPVMVPGSEKPTFVPVKIELTLNTEVAFTPDKVRSEFSIEKFIRGENYDGGFI